ncbi:MAG TPA: DUF5695 domain-containing protein [Capsulimonadaceae bacterium]|nr:DUF5695 domain-containing protein [Capsulimonadaceae bacterium]
MSSDRPRLSRRRFLQAAGLVGAGLALGVEAGAQDSGARKQTDPAQGPETSGPPGSPFVVRLDSGAIVSLKRAKDKFDTDYVRAGGRLGDVSLRYRHAGEEWQEAETSSLGISSIRRRSSDRATEYAVSRRVLEGTTPAVDITTRFVFDGQALLWSVSLKNLTAQPIEIGDLAIPLPMNGVFRRNQPATAAVLKHGLVSGHGSHIFWMRSNSVGPFLTFMPVDGAHLEYWDASREGYKVYIHSLAAGAEAKARGCHWRQPNTSLTLAPAGQPNDSQTYSFRFDWADGYDSVRQLVVDNGLVDVQIVPGMTVPSDLFARFALRTKQKIHSVEAEFPGSTKIESLGAKGDYHIYQARFEKLGENEITVRYGDGRHMFLEFFATEPLETLVKKRAAFVAAHQFRDPSKWYNGLLAEWNMESDVQLGPDNYDKITGWRIYEVTCDDPGLSKPAYLAAKNAEFPLQTEVDALDYYIQHFVWGGLQQTTQEPYPYAIYGIPDWKTNRDSADPGRNGRTHIWRCYDYPHIILMYFAMYRMAKYNPQIKTAMGGRDYLERAAGTAIALFTVPMKIEKWSAYETGFYNELVIVDLIDALDAEGFKDQADTLRGHWERKVRYFVNDGADLFGSEYPFDSTGFESTHALAKYAMQHTEGPEAADFGVTHANATQFLETQMAANIFCRGWLEPAYYLLGSDYRAGGGNSYTLTYMSQMGGWAVLDYALNYAVDPHDCLRLGFASYLSAWALVNSGTPESGYGFWFPGEANDGGAGGGFEPAPYGMTWLDQPHHRGSWYYSCEINLGYCGALRSAATVLADDPLFGRFAFGGDMRETSHGAVEVVPKDGVRRRFRALLKSGKLYLETESDRFAFGEPIALKDDLSEVRFQLESDNPTAHQAALRMESSTPGLYTVRANGKEVATVNVGANQPGILNLPVDAGGQSQLFVISRA